MAPEEDTSGQVEPGKTFSLMYALLDLPLELDLPDLICACSHRLPDLIGTDAQESLSLYAKFRSRLLLNGYESVAQQLRVDKNYMSTSLRKCDTGRRN
jgi:hypothetical protein